MFTLSSNSCFRFLYSTLRNKMRRQEFRLVLFITLPVTNYSSFQHFGRKCSLISTNSGPPSPTVAGTEPPDSNDAHSQVSGHGVTRLGRG